jgi:hypothetical protein
MKDQRVAVGFERSNNTLKYDITLNYETDDESLVDYDILDNPDVPGGLDIMNPLHPKGG